MGGTVRRGREAEMGKACPELPDRCLLSHEPVVQITRDPEVTVYQDVKIAP